MVVWGFEGFRGWEDGGGDVWVGGGDGVDGVVGEVGVRSVYIYIYIHPPYPIKPRAPFRRPFPLISSVYSISLVPYSYLSLLPHT